MLPEEGYVETQVQIPMPLKSAVATTYGQPQKCLLIFYPMDHRLNCEDSLLRTSPLRLLWMEHELFSVSETQGLVLCSLLIR